MEIRAELAQIRNAARRRMEREVRQKSEPLRAELAELTGLSRIYRRRNLTLSEVVGAVPNSRPARQKRRTNADG